MELTILRVTDETQNSLTTGFLLRLACQAGDGSLFQFDLPLFVSREVVTQRIPLPSLAVEYLKTQGLDEWPDLFLDTRQQDLSRVGKTEPAFPLTISLGGVELFAKRVVEMLKAKEN
jgi:hypothetical protein